MGYRNYIGSLPKKEWETIKNFTKKEILEFKGKESDDYLSVYDIAYNQLYNFGKYVQIENSEKYGVNVFNNIKTQQYFGEENDFKIVGKEFLELIIEHYALKVRDYYKNMLNPFKLLGDGDSSELLSSVEYTYDDDFNRVYNYDFTKITQDEINAFNEMLTHIKSMSTEWGLNFLDIRPYDLKNGSQVTTSWKFEYAQFELVRIYKSFDWDKNVMIYYGY